MTSPTPTTFTPRVLGDVDAKLVDGTDEQNEAVRTWLRTVLGNEAVPEPSFMNRSNVAVELPDHYQVIRAGQYAIWDGVSLRVADQLAFELVYSPSS
jgi:hypothetical protein